MPPAWYCGLHHPHYRRQQLAAGDGAGLATAYRKGMRLILVINVPAAVGLVVLAVPIIRLLFERGAFVAADTAEMQPVLAVYAAGLPVFAFVNLVLRAFYAQKDTVTPVRAALLSFGVNLFLSIGLMGPGGTVGLAVAGGEFAMGQLFLNRYVKLDALPATLAAGVATMLPSGKHCSMSR